MNNRELQIRLTLADEMTQKLKSVEGGIIKLTNSAKELGLKMRAAGREMSSVGSYMAMMGTALTAPLIAAYKEAGNFSAAISHQLNETKNVFQHLSVSIGEALLPVMRKLTDEVAQAVSWWDNLDKTTREKVISSIFTLGKTLIILGAAFMVVGKSLSALGNLALLWSTLVKLNPIVFAVSAGFALLGLAMWKCKAAGDAVVNTLQLIARLSPIANIARIFSGKTPDEFFGKQGSWAKGFDDYKKSFSDFSDWYKDFLKSMGGGDGEKEKQPVGGFFKGFEFAISQAMDKLRDFQQLGVDVANQLTTNLASAFESFINDAFSGQLKRAQDYFAAFGKSILDMFANVIAKMAAEWIAFQAMVAGKKLIGSIIGLLSSASSVGSASQGATNAGEGVSQGTYGSENFTDVSTGTVATPYYHLGGLIRAHKGLAIDEVPIIAQT
ncbi:MAG: hypothetical protein NTW06_01390, partial [Candidatus Falkowbacteria bacterium]|nr:hypothetical protein [Candidatus Falkowbacteria bacterium]